jgi:uncharacterized protein (DUF427 family)
MKRAIWKGAVLAETEDFEVVEGNVYFPAAALDMQYFRASEKSTSCWWKGTAAYYDVVVEAETNAAAAWYYAETLPKAAHIQGHVAFWGGVSVEST